MIPKQETTTHRHKMEGKLRTPYLIADMHCDTLAKVMKSGKELWERNEEHHLDLPRMKEAGVCCQFFAVCVQEAYRYEGGFQRTSHIFQTFQKKISSEKDIVVVKDSIELKKNIKKRRISAILSVEGGEALEGKIENLLNLYEIGVRSLTLTWNWRNALGDGVGVTDEPKGLTAFGKDVIKCMNDIGMVVDVSHIAVPGFWECLELSTKPVIASHSSCYALAPHPRNLRDSQIKAIADIGGVIGINFYPPFLRSDADKTGAILLDVLDHIDHVVEVGGIDCVAIGSDFDGIDSVPLGLEDVTGLQRLIDGLMSRGYKGIDLEKILNRNVIRVLSLLI